ncbi:FMN-binding protein [Spirochaetales bacterium NM-380-WT-3C1]|uniref:FMN-binding protein n=1 Tax=Bullifex porci TaxID=2606638 RepID=A0A7X2PDU0_9SPIO|nr:FMN-binding protein [Bullifex porci]MSU07018.1 FMN-binding protein [Bullifex porci]
MKKLLIALIIFIFFMVISCQVIANNAVKSIDSRPIIDINDVKDGVYFGKEVAPLVSVEVNVTVKDKRIVDIALLRHENGKGEKAEEMIPEMIKNNTSEVDIVSGATLSSKVIRAAVRNALLQGI